MRRILRVAAAALLSVGSVVAPAAAQVNGAALEVERVIHDGTAVRLHVTVPFEVRTPDLGPDDFRVSSADGPIDSTAQRYGGDRPGVVLALDTGVEASVLSALLGSVVQFIVDLPPEASVLVSSTSGITEAGTDRDAALAAVQGLAPTDPATTPFSTVLAAALASPPQEVAARSIVVVSDPGGGPAATDIDAAAVRDVVWSVQLTADGGVDESLVELATTTGGDVIPTTAPDQFLRALDRVRSESTGRYELAFDVPRSGRIVVTLDTADGPISATADVSATASGSASAPSEATPTTLAPTVRLDPADATGPTDEGSDLVWWIAALLALGAIGAALALIAVRASRTPPRELPGQLSQELPVVHVAPADPQRHGLSTSRSRTDRLRESADAAIARLHAERRRDPYQVSTQVSLPFEAAASAWLDDDSVRVEDAYAVLTDDDLPVDSSLPSVLRGLRTGLLLTPGGPEDDVPDRLYSAMAGATRSVLPARREPTADPADLRGGTADLAEAAELAVTIEREGRYGRASGVVARALVATWPSRHGYLDRCALLLSPSASPPDGATLCDLAPADHRDLYLWAVSDAAGRMIDAQQRTVDLVARYHDTAERLAPGQAALVTDLVTRRLVTIRRMSETLGADEGTALTHIERWVVEGRLTELPAGRLGERRWMALPLVDVVTRTLGGAGLPLEAFAATRSDQVGSGGAGSAGHGSHHQVVGV